MSKKASSVLICVICFFICVISSYAQESVTITTYYPSPYGSYRQLTADQIAIGSGYRNPTYADGSLYVQGNVGIGTTSPARRLHIAGGNGIRIQPSVLPNPAGDGDVAIDNTDNNLKWYAAGAWRMAGGGALPAGASGQTLRHDGTNWVANSDLFNNGTNVGIGTTSPTTKLEVNGILTASGLAGAWENSSGDSGYVDLGDLRIMWGSAQITPIGWQRAPSWWPSGWDHSYALQSSGAANGAFNITFPNSFNNVNYQVVASLEDPFIDSRGTWLTHVRPFAANSFHVWVCSPQAQETDIRSMFIHYIAFGNKP